MFGLSASASIDKFTLDALSRSLAIIEFDPKGKVISVNENFCTALGYQASEMVGQHHSMFVDPDYARGAEYREFWAKLGRGEFDAREYKRIGKGGRNVWIQASYNPVKGRSGDVIKVVKLATDITAAKLRNAEFEAKQNAVSLVQAVIEFTPTGEIITANENFLKLMDYRLDEIEGKHHRMFVEAAYSGSKDYQEFWRKLGNGEFIVDGFKRLGKGGKEVFLQASYNPIFDLNQKVMKVVKFATDISDLTDLSAGLSRMAAGVLDQPIQKTFAPSLEDGRKGFNATQEKLRSTILEIADGVNLVTSGSQEIATASSDLSGRTEQQAASLEETAAALDQVTATVKKASEGAKQARDVVSEARGDAEKSGDIVRRAVEAMGRIEKSAQEINQITGVIDEIAFQTNLLALNAGVEAARAGDAGRGFAVVASEVRALAQRSAEAAKDIKRLITTSTEEVGNGVKLVAETGDSLARIVGKVAQINSVVADIAGGADEQATALQEVNTAVNQMDRATQQNAAMAEQSTAAARSMMHETEKLSKIVNQFQLGRAANSDKIRSELKKAVPHAFASPAKAPLRPSASGAPASKPTAARVAPKNVVNGRSSGGNNEGWGEF
jgi:methyl-accepting chemotaxis protein